MTDPCPDLHRSVSGRLARALVAACLAVASVAGGSEPRNIDPRPDLYSYGAPSRDGIGKFYMGREISFVLGHRGITWLERPERAEEERPDLLIDLLNLSPDDVVADIGAGGGYLTFKMQPRVPRGKIVAVDIQPEMLDRVEARKADLGISNIATVLGAETDPNLPHESVDAVIMVDAYHEFSYPREMMEGIVRALRPGGRVYLVEYRAEDPEVPMKRLHKMSVKQAKREMAAVGLELEENRSGLPWQHLMVFRESGKTQQ